MKLIKIGLPLLVAIGVISAAAGSHGATTTGTTPSPAHQTPKAATNTISKDDALQNVIDQINAGPSWETAEMSAAVGANLSGKSGANDGCATLYNAHAQSIPGFACYLEYVDSTAPDANSQTGVVDVYFNADGNGKHIHPISASTYSNQTIGS